MEILVDGEGHLVPDPQNCSEGICTHPHMCDGAQIYERSVLLLERVAHRVAFSIYLNGVGLDLHGLTAAYRLYQIAGDSYAGACGNLGKDTVFYL